jgi:hypothetical protein
MSVTGEAVAAIERIAREAEKNKDAVKFLPGPDPRKQYLVRGAEREEVSVPPPARDHRVYTLEDLLTFAADFAGRCEEGEAAELVVWHNHEAVVLVLDDADRRDRVSFLLEKSAAWARLCQIGSTSGARFDLKPFIRLLRNEFQIEESRVGPFRDINFKLLQTAQAQVTRGKESLGRSIEAEAKTGSDDLPEEIEVTVPIYLNAGEGAMYPVRLFLDYDAQDAKIVVAVEADALEKRMQAHQQEIHGRCAAADSLRVYYGKP